MNAPDFPAFAKMLDDTYDLIGVGAAKVISPSAKALFFKDLSRYPLEYIEQALAAHRQDAERGRFTPKPADISYQIERRMPVTWLDADEVWAKMPMAQGKPVMLKSGFYDYRGIEPPPAIMCEETTRALADAQPLLDRGEETAARMAFKATYTRLAALAKMEGRAPKYFVSPGGSPEQQQEVRAEGIRLGLLAPTAEEKQALIGYVKPTVVGRDQLKALQLALKDLKIKRFGENGVDDE